MTRLGGRTALVTGAGRGIGLAISERLFADGARVVMLDRDAPAVEGAAKRLGSDARAVVVDVTRATDVDRAVKAAHDGHGRLDVVVNNAGITGRSVPTWELTDEDWPVSQSNGRGFGSERIRSMTGLAVARAQRYRSPKKWKRACVMAR